MKHAAQTCTEFRVLAARGVHDIVEVAVIVQDALEPDARPAVRMRHVDGEKLVVRLGADARANHLSTLGVALQFVPVRVEDGNPPRRVVGRLLERMGELGVQANPA